MLHRDPQLEGEPEGLPVSVTVGEANLESDGLGVKVAVTLVVKVKVCVVVRVPVGRPDKKAPPENVSEGV